MTMYASRTGTKRNLALMRLYGWRLLVSATGVWRCEGFPYAIDNGAWTAFSKGKPFDEGRFMGIVHTMGHSADWIVLPDVVGDATATARATDRWLSRLQPLPLLAVIQDGAGLELERLVGHVRGFFLGGSTEYKVANIDRWGAWCRERGAYYHVGRVNTVRRINRCLAAKADSCDGTSATRFAKNITKLNNASKQGDLFSRAS